MPRNFTLLVALLCSFSSLQAQQQKLRFESLPADLGSAGFGSEIMQDNQGFLWISLYGSGLYKYDGYNVTRYKHDPFDPKTLSQNNVYTSWIGSDNTIWIGTPEGICSFDPHTESFTRYDSTLIPGMPDLGNVSSIADDVNGNLWIGNYEGKLWKFDRSARKFLSLTAILHEHNLSAPGFHEDLNCIYKDNAGNIWIGDVKGLHKAIESPGGQISFIHYTHDATNSTSLGSNEVYNLFQDSKGIFWISTVEGLNSFDPRTEKFSRLPVTSFNPLLGGNSFVEDPEGNLWFGTLEGLYRLNKDRNQLLSWKEDPADPWALKSNSIYSLSIAGNNLFVGSVKGIQILNLKQKAFSLLQRRESYQSARPVDLRPRLAVTLSYPENESSKQFIYLNEVTSITGDLTGNIWIGSPDNGLDRWNNETHEIIHFQHNPKEPNSLAANYVNAMMMDPHGDLWIGNFEYLTRLKKGSTQFENFNTNSRSLESEDARNIYSICMDQEGLIWLGTGNGIKRFNPTTKEIKHYFYKPGDLTGISDYSALSIFADSRNNIWIGTGSIAFNKFDKTTERFTHYKNNVLDSTSIPSNIVYSIFEDSKHKLWIGTTSGGLCQYDYEHDRFITHTRGKDLPWTSIKSIQEDKDGNLWLGTENGLACYRVAQKEFVTYNVMDGLQDNFFGGGMRGTGSSFRDENGILYFGGPNGVTYFDPSAIHPNSTVPPVVITEFKVLDHVLPGQHDAQEIILGASENVFSFEFAALNFNSSYKNQYAYQLMGFDKDWIYSGSRRYASYTNLDPGDYTFKVKGSNNDGVWNEKGVSVKVTILPPWWRTWWAYGFYTLLGLAGLVVVDRVQRRRVIAREREQSREKELTQAREIEKAYVSLKQTQAQLIQSEKMASLGELTAGIAHEIQNPLNFVNNFSEVNTELIAEMKEALAKGNVDEAKSIANSIDENEIKIVSHGKRADAIVKGMLQHSRNSNGTKEPTDINALADEYLRLAYHGLRARDKSFNATSHSDFDKSIGLIHIISQDIGRVILNLITNAFYAVAEKKKLNPEGYEPTITVMTKKQNGHVEIRVTDNGNGIPSHIKDKIFQPFFTTKPTGQGTGLGLSLSYDIVKTHGGEIKVQTREGEGTEFTIVLPS